MKNIALIVAGGTGDRMSSSMPKQYLKLRAKTILRYTIEAFLSHPEIDAVKVVINKEHLELYNLATLGLEILPYSLGGELRRYSVLSGLRDLKVYKPQKVLIHDSVRPFISHQIITDVLTSLDFHQAVDVGVKPKDTVKDISNGVIVLDRELLYQTQTPQGFIFNTILNLHEEFPEMHVTDDISLALAKGLKISVVEGSYRNIKITTPEDLIISELLI